MSKEWFETWFDTSYYHILYGHRDENEARNFIGNLLTYLELSNDVKIIDIGCGRGRHAKLLNEKGYDVTGIDIASSSIEYAKQFENQHLHFYCHDKRKVFREGAFDVGLNLFTSYGFLKQRNDLEIALKSMAKNLKHGGIFVLDYLNEGKIKHLDLHKEEVENQGINFKMNKQITGHQIIKDIEVNDHGKVLTFREEVHLITLEEFRELFENASLKILHTFGDYQLNDYERTHSDRLILIAEKI